MPLTVKVLSYKGHPPEELLSASFDRQGGILGRSLENHFVLPDPDKYVSRKHAHISYENGYYCLMDTSTMGTFVTNKDLHVHRNKIQLADGDTLRIGDYDLIVSILSNDALEATPYLDTSRGKDPSFFNFGEDINAKGEPQIGEIIGKDKAFPGTESDILDLGPEPNHFRDHIEGTPLGDSFVPPEVAPPEQAHEIPKDFNIDEFLDDTGETGEIFSDLTLPEADTPNGQKNQWVSDEKFKEPHLTDDLASLIEKPEEQVKREPPAVPPKGVSVSNVAETTPESLQEAYGDLLNVFFEAAGITDTSFFPREEYQEIMRTVGAVFKELIEGLMTILRGRAELKSQFRVSMTIIKSDENNPLKFSPTVHEALKLLLTKNQPGFVDAVDAVREGYQDVMNHQLAITAGIQASLISLVSRFDPQKFVSKYEKGIVLQKKAKCWDAYGQAYRDIAREALENFFGEEFARAYEEQMLKLRTTPKKG